VSGEMKKDLIVVAFVSHSLLRLCKEGKGADGW